MKFIHEDPEFSVIIDSVAAEGPIRSPAMIEKDYWICHSLWALSQSGLQFWFKGGTSLSKAFNLIERFSEDIDLVVLPGTIANLPPVSSWKREAPGPNKARQAFWEALLPALQVPGAEIVLDHQHDETFRNPAYRVRYDALTSGDSVLRPYVFLETSYGNNARSAVAPSVTRPVTSAVHDWLAARGQLQEFTDNRAAAVECVHPYVTLIEKLDAITRRYHRTADRFEAASFARHYEDAARIIRAEASLPRMQCSAAELARTMYAENQIRKLVSPDDEAFVLSDDARRHQIQAGYGAIGGMFWGMRMTLDEACGTIIEWLRRNAMPEVDGPDGRSISLQDE